jgi:CheY-like chemotaxis protein
LLADDSVTAQNMGRKILADAGYEVITVNNGSAALKRIAETKPDLIVLDVYMPGYSGLEVCQRLKDSNDTARIPILLTVGKLEPFKPEEAKRVRAEGFIVKPFEASELLTAVTKLEDKIVPRADSSKPGRFARAIAAVEEGRYDKTVAIDEDSGWRNRISFPRKKKEKAPEPEDGDDAAIYNPVNRDLKTVVEHKPAHEPAHAPVQPSVQPIAQHDQAHVDLGALVAHGLPKDVTPEEIAALAAAAAQVQRIGEGRSSESVSSVASNVPETRLETSGRPEISSAQSEEARGEEIKSEASLGKLANAPAAETAEHPVVAPVEAKTEEAAKVESREAVSETAASSEKSSGEVIATFASENLQQKEDEPELKAPELPREETVSAGIDPSAIPSFATADVAPSSANDSSMYATPLPSERDVDATAVAAVPAASSRWTAVAVALAPEEASIALEEEMGKAQAAPIAEAPPQVAPVVVESRPIDESLTSADQARVAEALTHAPGTETPSTSMSSSPEPAAEEPPVGVTSATPVVKEFEAVAPRELEPSPAAVQAAVESACQAAAIATESAELAAAVPTSENAQEPKVEETVSAPVIESAGEPARSPGVDETAVSEAVTSVPSEAIVAHANEAIPADTQQLETAEFAESSLEQVPDSHISQSVEAAAVAASEGISGGFSDMAKKESEVAASTAAAWASWRRIRQTDDKGAEKQSESGTSPRDEAAMAVAAGAEKAPQEPSDDAEVSPEIASIVDTVLADLRPKIVEEISRKLGKKKK